MSVVIRFQSTGVVPGDGRPVPMVGNSLTIGRANDNDLVLPDPDRVISSHHCAIEDQNGNVVVIDLSTNGTFLNYGKVPLGRVPTPLNDGDILCIGGYELAVDCSSQVAADPLGNLPPPVATGPVGPGAAAAAGDLTDLLDGPGPERDFIDDLLGEAETPVGPKGIKRPELGEDGVLPPLGGDTHDGLLDPLPDPEASMGSSQSMHSPSMQDHMPRPRTVPDAIPDDWDLDLPSGDAAPALPDNPFDEPAGIPAPEMGGAAFIPEDDDLGLGPVAPTPGQSTDTAAAEPAETLPPAEPASSNDPGSGIPPASTGPTPAAPADEAAVTPALKPEGVQVASGAAPAADETGRAFLETFLEAAGVQGLEVPDDEIPETIARLGNVLRIMIHGMREILMTRTSIKSEFRIDQTRIAASGNNPLKFSVTPEQAVEVMVKPSTRGYLDAEAAAEQALQDIKAHEVATMTGMEAALKGVLQKLAPEELEGQITTAGGLGGLLKGKKARYWETYEKIYADVADQAENDFQDLFSREFARAYQEQLERLKGLE